jgi:hypothetical protein
MSGDQRGRGNGERVIQRRRIWEADYIPSRVKNPAQKPRTHPNTIENCSMAINAPRNSGGLISAI